jgi:16S rRNA G966 N2-methylase RsmD
MAYIRYFFYLGINWNWRIALVILLQEIKGEKEYGIDTTGADELKKLKAAGIDTSQATIYMPVSYLLLEKIFEQLPTRQGKHFVDIGCGKGRALCIAASKGYQKITGVDFSAQLCASAVKNLDAIKTGIPSLNYSVLNMDAADFTIPADADCIFLFNPFNENLTGLVANNIINSLTQTQRMLHVVYVNPLYKKLFLEKGFAETYHFKSMKYFEVSILHFQH